MLKEKKRKILADRDSLMSALDEFAEQAENKHQVTLIAKSNAMRKSGKLKEAELQAVNQQLQDKLLEPLVSTSDSVIINCKYCT
jgi:hypothetical protein